MISRTGFLIKIELRLRVVNHLPKLPAGFTQGAHPHDRRQWQRRWQQRRTSTAATAHTGSQIHRRRGVRTCRYLLCCLASEDPSPVLKYRGSCKPAVLKLRASTRAGQPAEDKIAELNEHYQAYTSVEQQLLHKRARLSAKLPEIQKTLDALLMLKQRQEDEQEVSRHQCKDASCNFYFYDFTGLHSGIHLQLILPGLQVPHMQRGSVSRKTTGAPALHSTADTYIPNAGAVQF